MTIPIATAPPSGFACGHRNFNERLSYLADARSSHPHRLFDRHHHSHGRLGVADF